MLLSTTIDIIIPVFNQYTLVKGCIDSILKSNLKVDYEIVVINDCSTETELNQYLQDLSEQKKITLIVNTQNQGFTKNVNLGMKLHPIRDVILLNSDTVVYNNWLDRIKDAAYSESKIGTVIPLSNACHISNYPKRTSNQDVTFEIQDCEIDYLASQLSPKYIKVPTTVGFCMYIKRAVLNAVGYFDDHYFPIGYGEETDFCYRARKIGWEHIVVGNVFVRHYEGSSSFGEKKLQLMDGMIKKFQILHPDLTKEDKYFQEFDPVWGARYELDVARLKKALNKVNYLNIVSNSEVHSPKGLDFLLIFEKETSLVRMVPPSSHVLPNLENYCIPRELASFNRLMLFLGIEYLVCASEEMRSLLIQITSGLECEIKLLPTLKVDSQFLKSA
jgi:O-antigen biosynthesis protein